MFLAFCSFAFTTDDYKLIESIPFKGVDFITTDNLGNIYVIVGNQLLQFDPAGKPKANFSENSLGELRSIDASNPMKLVLFYPDFGRIILLNSQLSIQSHIYLRQLGIEQASIACGSDYGGYWVFDRQDFQLKKVDLNLQVVYQSGDLLSLTGLSISPNYLSEYDGFVYMNDPKNGIFVFDRYGTYYKTIPLKVPTSFQILKQELLHLSENKLMAFHLKSLAEREILLPLHDTVISARIENQQLYLLTSDSLTFYSF